MPIIIDATWGGETANSYVTYLNANSIAATLLERSFWIKIKDDDTKIAALIQAAQDIDHAQKHIGLPLYHRQRRAFPRSMASSTPLRTVEITTFDIDQQNQLRTLPVAQVKQAIHRLQLLDDPPILEAQNKGLFALSSGGGNAQSIYTFSGTGSVLSMEVRQLLGDWKAPRRVLRG